jgi:tRNA 2-thiouridine synthesizing protein A
LGLAFLLPARQITAQSGLNMWAKMKGLNMLWDVEIDCVGMLCPLPVLRARKRLIGMLPGSVLRVLATDAMAAVDLPHFCKQSGHEFLGASPTEAAVAYLIRRGNDQGRRVSPPPLVMSSKT